MHLLCTGHLSSELGACCDSHRWKRTFTSNVGSTCSTYSPPPLRIIVHNGYVCAAHLMPYWWVLSLCVQIRSLLNSVGVIQSTEPKWSKMVRMIWRSIILRLIIRRRGKVRVRNLHTRFLHLHFTVYLVGLSFQETEDRINENVRKGSSFNVLTHRCWNLNEFSLLYSLSNCLMRLREMTIEELENMPPRSRPKKWNREK